MAFMTIMFSAPIACGKPWLVIHSKSPLGEGTAMSGGVLTKPLPVMPYEVRLKLTGLAPALDQAKRKPLEIMDAWASVVSGSKCEIQGDFTCDRSACRGRVLITDYGHCLIVLNARLETGEETRRCWWQYYYLGKGDIDGSPEFRRARARCETENES